MEIEKLMCHHSVTKERINFGTAILFLIFFISLCHKAGRMTYGTTVLERSPGGIALRKRDGKVLAGGEAGEIIACVFC